jgi:hypothetical protein
MAPTSHAKIWVFQSRQLSMSFVAHWITTLQHLLYRRDAAAILDHMRILVPEYCGGAVQSMTVSAKRRIENRTEWHAEQDRAGAVQEAAG